MKRRTLMVVTTFGRMSCWAVGLGLLAIGIGEGLNTGMLTIASEREG